MMEKRSHTDYHKFPKHLHFFCEGQRFALALKEIKQWRSGWEWSSHKIGCIFAFVQANLKLKRNNNTRREEMMIKPRCTYFNKSCEVSESLDKTRTFIQVNTFYLDLSFEAALHRDHHIGRIPTALSYPVLEPIIFTVYLNTQISCLKSDLYFVDIFAILS